MLLHFFHFFIGVILLTLASVSKSASVIAKTGNTPTELTFHSISELGCGTGDFDKAELQAIALEPQPSALYTLALYYYKQRSYCQNIKDYDALLQQVIQWLNVAASQHYLLAQRYLASIYIDELGEIEQGIYWLKQAAKQNSPEAKFILSTAYNYGEGVEQNRETALILLKESAE